MNPPALGGPAHNTNQLAEVLDRVLDRGIVIDAEISLNVAGLALAGIECRVVVASIETYLEYADAIGNTAPASWRAESDHDEMLPPLSIQNIRNRARPFLEGLGDGLP